MLSSESKQRLHEKIQQPPGNWFVRKMKTTWYMVYGMMLLILKMKFIREMFSRNKRYDPGSEPSMLT